MCEKCQEFDVTIARYERITSRLTDRQTVERIELLISELQKRKAELHPGPNNR